MKCEGAIDTHQIFIIPTVGWIDHKWYYGYPVFVIAFAWLCFRFSVKLGVKKVRVDNA